MSNCCLSFRNLLSNPFICNCHLAWFSEWLQKHDLSGGNPRCNTPPRVKDVPIHELPHHEFKCTSMLQKRLLSSCLTEIRNLVLVQASSSSLHYLHVYTLTLDPVSLYFNAYLAITFHPLYPLVFQSLPKPCNIFDQRPIIEFQFIRNIALSS